MKIPTFPNRPHTDHVWRTTFHQMIGANLFTDSQVWLNVHKKTITIVGRWGVNKEMKSKFFA